ncbi:purine-nucleoside phosphorylase [Flavobacteriaceae bacterium S0825]|uniref:purine-nucleoside phosphorylase n=1 Tax=Gaetbulibacter sp. S0825 TaxID=2720084 RepID=UPI001431EBC3|nr:purine-nucleoside phosphorylase [Gaetbulibacter sp. S0825]MCK0109211.1 purine-nucleoside phosphorylase [Flavobacteriaceae bacterium S0825]NIX64846.1 purine-nucleoside phosphorylase [Gaetbulibacter sp. S0825]
MSSIHIEAKVGDIAETVLLPGDPLRAKYVAETYLKDVVCYNKVRNMFGFTGYYNGKKVSVQGTGMGMGSASIYIHELINTYNAKNLIRIGTCGSIQENINLGQVVLAMSASGDSDANSLYFEGMHYAATADFDLLLKAYEAAQKLNIKTYKGSVFSTNTFYDDIPNRWGKWQKHGILGVEMESQMLFTLAKRFDVKALSILTVSDNIVTGESTSSKEREQSFNDMMKIALELA